VVNIKIRWISGCHLVIDRVPLTANQITVSRYRRLDLGLRNQNFSSGVTTIAIGIDPVPKKVSVISLALLGGNDKVGYQNLQVS
jgi:hypothetical protein